MNAPQPAVKETAPHSVQPLVELEVRGLKVELESSHDSPSLSPLVSVRRDAQNVDHSGAAARTRSSSSITFRRW